MRRRRRSPWIGLASVGLVLALISVACNPSANFLDLESLRRYLNLTAAQTDRASGSVRLAVEEVEGYIRHVRERQRELNEQTRSRIDERIVLQDSLVVKARLETARQLAQIAVDLRKQLTPEQQAKFDRILLPDLKQSSQDIQFAIMQSRRGMFSELQVKPIARLTPLNGVAALSDTARYNALKEQRTLVIGPGGFGTGTQQFPVVVTATLVDSILTEAEIRYTAPPDSLDGDAGKARRLSLLSRRHTRDGFSIRIVLSTFLHESYASMDRWVVFIEDQDGNPYEPTEVVEDMVTDNPDPSRRVPMGFLGERDTPLSRKAQQYDLRFPYNDALGNPVWGSQTRSIQLILFDKNDSQNRTQGEWLLR